MHDFWIKAENIDVLQANLAEGKVYMVETNAIMGAFSAGAKFFLIDFNKERIVKRLNRIFTKKTEKIFTYEELQKGEQDNRFVIERGMKKVKKKLKKNKRLKVITSDMYVEMK